MKTLVLLYAVYFFGCYFFDAKPSAEGVFLPVIIFLLLCNYSAIQKDKEVNIYLTKEQIERLSETVEEMEDERD